MPKRVRRLVYGAVVFAALTTSAAHAVPPVKEDQPPPQASFPAGAFCDFPVSWVATEFDAFTTTHVDASGNVRWIFGGGRNVVRVTNDASGASLDVNASGPGKITFDPDGTIRITGGGPWLLGFFPTDSPSKQMLLVTGHLVLTVDPSTGKLTLVSFVGATRDLCAELA